MGGENERFEGGAPPGLLDTGRFKVFFDSVQRYAIFMLDVSGNVAMWSAGARAITGFEAEDMMGRPASRLYARDGGATFEATLTAARSRGEVREGAWRVRKNGQRFFGECVVTALREGAEEQRGFACVLEDVTERRRHEEERARLVAELQEAVRARDESLAILDTILQAGPVGIAFVDRQLRHQRLNPALSAISGMSHEACRGKRLSEILPEIATKVEPILQQVLDSGRPVTGVELSGETPSQPGVARSWLANYYPVRVKDGGAVLGVGAVVTEITAQKRVEAEQRFLARASDALSRASDGSQIARQVAKLVVPEVVETCVVVLSGDRATPGNFAHEDASNSRSALVNDWRRSEAALDVLVSCLGAERTRIIPLNASGVTLGVIVVVGRAPSGVSPDELVLLRDVAERAAAALERARLLELARAATRARDDFLGIVSHDMKCPLQAIELAASHLAGITGDSKPAARKTVQVVQSASGRLRRLIADLLDAASIEAGKLAIDAAPCSVAGLLRDAVEALRPIAAKKPASLSAEAPAADVLVLGDRDRIQQVLANLIDNAVKFMDPGGSVSVGATVLDREVVFAVQDTGPGIPATDLPWIFDRYWQGRPRGRTGTGLGLAIVRGVVEAHRGRVWVESQKGVGSVFRFTLPRA